LREPELQAGGPEEVTPSATLPVGLVPVPSRLGPREALTGSGGLRRQSTDADASHVFAISGQKQ